MSAPDVQGGVYFPSTKYSSAAGAGGTGFRPFEIVDATTFDNGQPDVVQVRVYYSTLAGEAPDGFSQGDDPPYLLEVQASGVVFGCISIDTETGAVNSRTLGFEAEIPDDEPENGVYYKELGSVEVNQDGLVASVANAQFGPVHAVVFKEYFLNPMRWVLAWID